MTGATCRTATTRPQADPAVVGGRGPVPDGEFTIEAVRCLGCCGLAPVVVVNGEVHGKLGKGDVGGLIQRYRESAKA